MRRFHKNCGFSLMEVLLAVGTLAIGMVFIAGVFPVGIHFSTIATERTIAAVAADEAFAKIKLYSIIPGNLLASQLTPFETPGVTLSPIDPNEFAYPSTNTNPARKQYYWSALCRPVGLSDVQITVFVNRKAGRIRAYWERNIFDQPVPVGYPVPVYVNVSQPFPLSVDELQINDINPADSIDESTFINDGYTIVDNVTGNIYRVLERDADVPNVIILDRPWQSGNVWPRLVWVVPPAVGGGRYPCIAVYQKVIRF